MAEGGVINLEGAVNRRVGREGGEDGGKFEGASEQVVTPIACGQITLGKSVDTRREKLSKMRALTQIYVGYVTSWADTEESPKL